MSRLRIVQITERDKEELSELGCEAVEAVHEFLECLDKVTDGQISEEMAERYGERRGVPGTGRYRRRYGRRIGERQGVAGTGRYGRRVAEPIPPEPIPPVAPEHMGERYGEHYPEYREEGYGERSGGGYGNRYMY